jgi:hypothetical protein
MEYDLAKNLLPEGELKYIFFFISSLLMNKQTEYGYIKFLIEDAKNSAKSHKDRIDYEQQLQDVEVSITKDKKVFSNVILDVYEHRSEYKQQYSGYYVTTTSAIIELMLKTLTPELIIQTTSGLEGECKLYCLHMLLYHELKLGATDVVNQLLKIATIDELKNLLTMASSNKQDHLVEVLSKAINP